MKVEKAETKFTPVVITLESQNEPDTLITALNVGCGDYFEEGKSCYVSDERVQYLMKKNLPASVWSMLVANL